MTKSILITGCSSGIGYTTALYLHNHGWQVFASCRKPEDCKRLRGEGFHSPLIDYADPATIQSGLGEVLEVTNGKLDAVFNNGAFAVPGYLEDLPREALRELFEANYFGVHDLTRAVIPHMRAQGHGRILQCSSVLGFVGIPVRGAYVSSKHAMEGHADVLRLELANDPIDVVLIEPGPITTNIRINSREHFERHIDWENSARREEYRDKVLPRLYSEDGKKDKHELPPVAVAEIVHKALLAKRPKARYYVTTPTHLAAWGRRLLPTKLLDKYLM